MVRSFCTKNDCEMIPVSEERRKHKKRGTCGGGCKSNVRYPLRIGYARRDQFEFSLSYSRAKCGTSIAYRSRSVGDRNVGQ